MFRVVNFLCEDLKAVDMPLKIDFKFWAILIALVIAVITITSLFATNEKFKIKKQKEKPIIEKEYNQPEIVKIVDKTEK